MRKRTVFLLAIGFILLLDGRTTRAQNSEPKLIGEQVARFDFEQKGIDGWKAVDGRWSVEESKDAPNGKRVLVASAQVRLVFGQKPTA